MLKVQSTDIKLIQVFSTYLANNMPVQSVDELSLTNNFLDEADPLNAVINELFELGKNFPLENLGIYANVLTASVSVKNWFDALVAMLNELAETQPLFINNITPNGGELRFPIHPAWVTTQCAIAGLIYRLVINAELVGKDLVQCKFNKVFSKYNTAVETDDVNTLFSIYIKNSNLTHQLSNANSRVYNVFARQLAIYQKGKHNRNNLEYKALTEVMRTTDWASFSQSSVASTLAMSERSLTRKLQQKGLKFRDIVSLARNTQALTLLFKGIPVGQVSDTLGFSDRATFERSFRKWQGLSPAKIQAQYVLLASETEVDSIISSQELPHLPATMTQLLSLLKQEQTDIEEVITLLETDPVLVAKILRITNSSMYSNIKAENLKQAVVAIFGFDKLYALTLSIVSTTSFSKTINSFNYKAFWHHALLSAWVVEQLADRYKVTKSHKETLYLAALLHNIGELVLHYCLPNKMAQFSSDFAEPITWREHNRYQRLKLGTCATAVSSFVCHLWHIPKPVCELIDSLTLQSESCPALLVDTLDIVDYLLFPTKQTQSVCKLLFKKHWGINQSGIEFLNYAKLIRDDLKTTANDLI
jgi:HD-like signal output (HDOD) protein/AraC-like DNA-binding protein